MTRRAPRRSEGGRTAPDEKEVGPPGSPPPEDTDTTTNAKQDADKNQSTSDDGADEAKATAQYLQACFGEANGYAFVGLGHSIHRLPSGSYKYKQFEEKVIEWPDDTEVLACALIELAGQGIDVHVCPYLMREKKRSKGGAVERMKAHADLDKPDKINQDRLVSLMDHAYVVESGSPDRYHVYCPLTHSVSQAWHEALCRGLAAYIGGADPAKWSDNDYLRPPGTLNRKATVDGGSQGR